jgi:hypothetical protein
MTVFIAGLIRTVVPAIVGALAAWLVSLGLDLPADAYEGLTAALGLLFTGIYYAVVRLIEDRVPQFGCLLGLAKSPDSYSKGPGVQLTQKPDGNPEVTIKVDGSVNPEDVVVKSENTESVETFQPAPDVKG